MSKSTTTDAGEVFGNAKASQTIFNLQNRVEELEEEIVSLQSKPDGSEEKRVLEEKIQSLVDRLSQSEGVQIISFDQVTRNPLQPRVVFTKKDQTAFANILREEGQSTPALLIELTEDIRQQLSQYAAQGLFDPKQPRLDLSAQYLIFDGERRWRSGPEAELEGLKAVIIPINHALNLIELQAKAASTTLHQRTFHPLELAQFLSMQIGAQYPEILEELSEPAEIAYPRILNAVISRLKAHQRLPELSRIATEPRSIQLEWLDEFPMQEKGVLDVLLRHQQNPSTVNRHVFPMLRLPPDLKQIVYDEGWEAKRVTALNQINAKNLKRSDEEATQVRQELIQQALEEQWTTSKIQDRVKQTIAAYCPDSTPSHPRLPKEVTALESTNWSDLPPNDLRLCQKILSRQLKVIREQLGSSKASAD